MPRGHHTPCPAQPHRHRTPSSLPGPTACPPPVSILSPPRAVPTTGQCPLCPLPPCSRGRGSAPGCEQRPPAPCSPQPGQRPPNPGTETPSCHPRAFYKEPTPRGLNVPFRAANRGGIEPAARAGELRDRHGEPPKPRGTVRAPPGPATGTPITPGPGHQTLPSPPGPDTGTLNTPGPGHRTPL